VVRGVVARFEGRFGSRYLQPLAQVVALAMDEISRVDHRIEVVPIRLIAGGRC
jgi:hypothetical protein